ncbi:predicted protein [Uncinocarpus reesii 1704]|uniref:Protein kinase domain-containing protein n=1 Tax=Uncinocarpus reesii (strain UAMH 1704) TaxID=336963 RepID=C4JWH9_UNCRE|nr:uncharacterized protein UREG_06921 [Uncinocarpus reesii 1704]EEP82056.1 predicted protein [Uncinocarpus reesii 1704]
MIGRWLSELPMDDPTRKSTSRPMLRRFIHHTEPIKFIKYIGHGAEGRVYLIEVLGSQYALKIFSNWTYTSNIYLRERQKPYTFPFSHECRAFARLDSLDENGTWAVKCHGWIKLSDEQFKPLQRFSGLSRWAIVKDYIPNEVSISDVPEIRRKMTIARKALLYPKDLQPRNFRGSFLVDLGAVRTYPYPPQRFWSNTRRREYFAWFDKDASQWEVSVRDGKVIEGWLNRMIKGKPSPCETAEAGDAKLD